MYRGGRGAASALDQGAQPPVPSSAPRLLAGGALDSPLRSPWLCYRLPMLTDLSTDERMRLMRFVCSFAWADLGVRDEERRFVADLVRRLDLDDDEIDQVIAWLDVPPAPEEVDPSEIPVAHRQVFLSTVLALSAANGEVSVPEAETYNLLRQLVRLGSPSDG